MQTVNSLSGGKTSSFLEKHYPADISLFALVCSDDHNTNSMSTTFKLTPQIKQMVNDRLQKYCSDMPEFVGTMEDPIIIKTMFDLEQHTGREITWLRGEGFQSTTFGKSMLPNKKHRFCTTIFKIEPIFNFMFRYHTLPCKMRIGFRSDEADRANTFKDTWTMATHTEVYYPKCGEREPGNCKSEFVRYKDRLGGLSDYGYHSLPHRHRWQEVPFRIGEFPLIEDGITQQDVQNYWKLHPEVVFAKDSNCQMCFWKNVQQLRENWDNNPSIMASAGVVEDMQQSTLLPTFSMFDIKNINPQLDIFSMKGGGCHGGYCTS